MVKSQGIISQQCSAAACFRNSNCRSTFASNGCGQPGSIGKKKHPHGEQIGRKRVLQKKMREKEKKQNPKTTKENKLHSK